MRISEIHITLADVRSENDRIRAYFTMTFDDQFVVRDIKLISSSKKIFSSMPQRKISDRCPECKSKNSLLSKYCCQCGTELKTTEERAHYDDEQRQWKTFADVAFPCTKEMREYVDMMTMLAYQEAIRHQMEEAYIVFNDNNGIFSILPDAQHCVV